MSAKYVCTSCQRSLLRRTGSFATPRLHTATALNQRQFWSKAAAISEPSVDIDTITSLELIEKVRTLGKEGKSISVTDRNGERQMLAYIPDDVRTYSWRSSAWTWGVLERLFQDCEQAKVTFKTEDYVDELDGKTKKRVISDEKGMHIGQGEGWFFDGTWISSFYDQQLTSMQRLVYPRHTTLTSSSPSYTCGYSKSASVNYLER